MTTTRLIRPANRPRASSSPTGGRRFYLPEASACELVLRLAEQGIADGEPILICLESFHGRYAAPEAAGLPAAEVILRTRGAGPAAIAGAGSDSWF